MIEPTINQQDYTMSLIRALNHYSVHCDEDQIREWASKVVPDAKSDVLSSFELRTAAFLCRMVDRQQPLAKKELDRLTAETVLLTTVAQARRENAENNRKLEESMDNLPVKHVPGVTKPTKPAAPRGAPVGTINLLDRVYVVTNEKFRLVQVYTGNSMTYVGNTFKDFCKVNSVNARCADVAALREIVKQGPEALFAHISTLPKIAAVPGGKTNGDSVVELVL